MSKLCIYMYGLNSGNTSFEPPTIDSVFFAKVFDFRQKMAQGLLKCPIFVPNEKRLLLMKPFRGHNRLPETCRNYHDDKF